MPHSVTHPNGYRISDDRTRLDMDFVCTWLATANWAERRPRDLTLRSWSNCLCFGITDPQGAPAGFGRVMTDYTFRAHIADVFITPAHRGFGLGKALVETMLAHPELVTVGAWTLTTDDAQDLHTRYGFRLAEADGKAMIRLREP